MYVELVVWAWVRRLAAARLRIGAALLAVLAMCVLARASDSPQKVPDAILRGIEANYARIKSVQATVESTMLDFGVTERTVTTSTNGALTCVVVRQPKTVFLLRLMLHGNDIYRGWSKDGEEQDYLCFFNGVWTQFSAESKMAWRRLPEQMPGLFPIDPRDFGSAEIRERFSDRLRSSKVVEAKKDRHASGVIFARLVMEQENGRRWAAEFDASKSFLPAKVEEFRDDGTVVLEMRAEYRQVLKEPEAAWFPEAIVRKFFGRPGDKSANASGVTTMLTEAVKGDIRVNQDLPDDVFDKELPAGTRVSDAVNTSVYNIGRDDVVDDDTRLKLGNVAPEIELGLLDGKTIRMRPRSKPLLIIFFTTWCGPCVSESPRIEKEIWQRFKGDDLEVVAVGREHTHDELAAFKKDGELSFPMAADPNRDIYGKFAVKGVPRAYLISHDGKIAYQSVGYTPPKFDALVKAIEHELQVAGQPK